MASATVVKGRSDVGVHRFVAIHVRSATLVVVVVVVSAVVSVFGDAAAEGGHLLLCSGVEGVRGAPGGVGGGAHEAPGREEDEVAVEA